MYYVVSLKKSRRDKCIQIKIENPVMTEKLPISQTGLQADGVRQTQKVFGGVKHVYVN